MENKRPAEMDYFERQTHFHQHFDLENDACVTLVALVRAAGDFLEKIVGPKATDEGMSKIIGTLSVNGPSAWREDLEEGETGAYSEWHAGEDMHVLSAYARYGIYLPAREHEGEEETADRLKAVIHRAESLLSDSPLDQWLGPDRPQQFEDMVLLARNRWALDNDEPVEPEALALFGGVAIGSVRNMLSQKKLSKVDGKVPAHEATAWLRDKPDFFPSIWRSGRPEWDGTIGDFDYVEPIFVPQAQDRSIFHPGLKRNDAYTVGAKGEEKQVASFKEALRELQEMRHPSWRRPSRGKGGWSIVSAMHWVRLSEEELDHKAKQAKEG